MLNPSKILNVFKYIKIWEPECSLEFYFLHFFNYFVCTTHFSLLLMSCCSCCTYLCLFPIPLERDIHVRSYLVKGHMKKVWVNLKAALMLCRPVGQSTKVLLLHITLLPPSLCLTAEAKNTLEGNTLLYILTDGQHLPSI